MVHSLRAGAERILEHRRIPVPDRRSKRPACTRCRVPFLPHSAVGLNGAVGNLAGRGSEDRCRCSPRTAEWRSRMAVTTTGYLERATAVASAQFDPRSGFAELVRRIEADGVDPLGAWRSPADEIERLVAPGDNVPGPVDTAHAHDEDSRVVRMNSLAGRGDQIVRAHGAIRTSEFSSARGDAASPVPRRFAVTGAPGSGKTAMLACVRDDRIEVVAEAATDVNIALLSEGRSHPERSPDFIDRIVALQRQRRLAAHGRVQLHDRTVYCTLALARHLELPITPGLSREVDEARDWYDDNAFFVCSLGFVEHTPVRRITVADAQRFELVHRDVYLEQGFTLIDIPAGTIEERAAALLAHLARPQQP